MRTRKAAMSEQFLEHALATLGLRRKLSRASLRYSARSRPFGASAKLYRNGSIKLVLSASWVEIAQEIKLGLALTLLCRLLKLDLPKHNSIALYHSFIQKLGAVGDVEPTVPELAALFDQLNRQHFFGFLDRPRLIWAELGKRCLGRYDFVTNTIALSPALRRDPKKLAAVLYHEMLHKKHGFRVSRRRLRYHTAAFRADERAFEGCSWPRREGGLHR